MSSNPYELRFKLLEMAQGYLQDEYSRKENFVYQAWDYAKEQGEATSKLWNELQPKSYTIDDIKTKATELYEFVEHKAIFKMNTQEKKTLFIKHGIMQKNKVKQLRSYGMNFNLNLIPLMILRRRLLNSMNL